jgi:GT2 family glycosyltransferase
VTFWEIFFRVLPSRPWAALVALYWHLTRRRVRARIRLRVGTVDLPAAYRLWMKRVEAKEQAAKECPVAIGEWPRRPSFSILLHGPEGAADPQRLRTLSSLEGQSYPFWNVVETSHDAVDLGISAASGDYVIALHVGDELSATALFRFAEALQADIPALILYGDHDELDPRGRRVRPWFKPRWNEEMFLAQDFLSPAVAIERRLAQAFAAQASAKRPLDRHAFLLGVTSRADGRIAHVPHILCHADPSAVAKSASSRVEAVACHVQPLGASCTPGLFGTAKVSWPLPPSLPRVSIIIPTRNKVELLRPCIDSVLKATSYAPFEILVVDNGSNERATLAYLGAIAQHRAVRVIAYDEPYNYSAINNFAARTATGSYLCLLNNDTEVVEPDWLTEMMRYAVRPDVGAVGAKLLYGNGTIQHAGVVIGIGEGAGHPHRFTAADESGYFRQPHVAHFASAVTAACLVVETKKFEAVGGLDEQELAIAYNDVDLCLKLQAAGWRNVYVPHAVLLHHESQSRGSDMSAKHRQRHQRELNVLQQRWGTQNYQDPLHNPNLERGSETYVVRL